jgi:hypothetical protein
LRATRGDEGDEGFLITRAGLQTGLGYRNRTIYLLRPYGVTAATTLPNICRSLHARTGAKIIIKKVGTGLSKTPKSRSDFKSDKSLDDRTLLEDDYHPELRINLDRLFPGPDTINPTAKNLNKKYRKFANSSSTSFTLDELHNNRIALEDVKLFLSKHQSKGRAYSLIAEAVCRADPQGCFISSVYRDLNTIRGVYIAERLNSSTAGLYCALTLNPSNGMTEWMDVSFFQKLKAKGITEILLGGCETDGVYNYCKKLLAGPPSYRTESLVFNPRLAKPMRQSARWSRAPSAMPAAL